MKISREIGVYQKQGEEFLDSFPINLPEKELIRILNVFTEDDPNLYKIYPINEGQYLDILALIPELPNYDFNEVEIFYECHQI